MLSQNLNHLPQKKKKTKVWLIVGGLILIIAICFMIFVLWFNQTIETKNSPNSQTKVFVIKSGEGAGEISANLKEAGLLKNYFALVLYLNLKDLGDQVQAGEYKIPANLNIKELAQIITLGKITTGRITIPEGWDIEKIGIYLEKNTVISKDDFTEAAKFSSKYAKYEFLKGMNAGDSLEGFLYPDTYQISLKPTADEVVSKMLENFNKKLTTKDRADIKKSGMSTREVVTLASIVEAEVASSTDRKMVASVFLNRLNDGMPLESDATVAYTLKSGSRRLTYEEVRTPTPFNTYLTAGLPKGPIGNPSIDSIRAVLNPTQTNYYYFISVKDKTYFAKTLAEHNALVAKYLD